MNAIIKPTYEQLESLLQLRDDEVKEIRSAAINQSNIATDRLNERDKRIEEISEAYDDYIKLLGEEISDLMGLAMVHGIFETSRVKAGEQCRKTISELKAVSKLVSDEDVKAIAKEKYSREDYSNFQQGKIIGFQDGYKADISKGGARWVRVESEKDLPKEFRRYVTRYPALAQEYKILTPSEIKEEFDAAYVIEYLDESPMQLGGSGWISVEDGLPEDDENVWGGYFTDDAETEGEKVFYCHEDKKWFSEDACDSCERIITHWRNLPVRPKK